MRAILVIVIFTCTLVAEAQSIEDMVKRARSAFDDRNYSQAVVYFEEAFHAGHDDINDMYNMAESYRHIFDYQRAEHHYKRVAYLDSKNFKLSGYFLGLMQKYNGKYYVSTNTLREFLSTYTVNDDSIDYGALALMAIEGNDLALSEFTVSDSYKATVLPYPVNAYGDEFGPLLWNADTLLMTTTSKHDNRIGRAGEAHRDFSDIEMYVNNNGSWEKSKFDMPINTKYHDATGTFSPDRKIFYYTTCNPKCEIWYSELEKGRWQYPKKLNENINEELSDNKHGVLSRGGDTLFFVSNRAGGYGGNDIWMSLRSEKHNWGPAINLGASINTRGNEVSPLTTILTNTLLFASDGHVGYGGTDLFMAKSISSGDTLIYNLGYPFNSSGDDLMASFNDTNLFWTSNRNADNRFDIYKSNIRSEISFLSRVSLKMAQKKNRQEHNQMIASRTSGAQRYNINAQNTHAKVNYENLYYEDRILVNKMYSIKSRGGSTAVIRDSLTDDKYQLLLGIVNARMIEQQRKLQQYRYHIDYDESVPSPMTLTLTLMDSATNRPISGALVVLQDHDGNIIKRTTSNQLGIVKMTNVPNQEGSYLTIEQVDKMINTPAFKGKRIQHFNIENDHGKVAFEKVYFDFSSYSLRPEAMLALDEIANYLIINNNAQLEIFGYADPSGSSEYNLKLSEDRAEEVMYYLIANGVDPTLLSIVPMGEFGSTAPRGSLSAQLNRRVEFKITGDYGSYMPSVKTYFTNDLSYIKKLAGGLGGDVDELAKLNGWSDTSIPLRQYTPIRIPHELADAKNIHKYLIKY